MEKKYLHFFQDGNGYICHVKWGVNPFIPSIIFENDYLLVINKPPFISSAGERVQGIPHVLETARRYCPEVMLCHRLDKETSGVLLLAKDKETYRQISMSFEHRKVEKIYHAMVSASVQFENYKVNKSLKETKKAIVVADTKGKPAETFFSTHLAFKHFTLLECRPVTGRMHQIRVHLSLVNLPITGDILYGGTWPYLSALKRKYKINHEEENPIFKRVALHAYSLSLNIYNENFVFQADYPDDFKVFLKLLNKYDLHQEGLL